MTPIHIAIIGEALLDFAAMPSAPGSAMHFAAHPGGAPANTAIAAARLGQPTGLLAQLSRDMLGEFLYAHLQDNGVNMQRVQRSDAPSTLAFVEHGPNTNHYTFYIKDTADTLWSPDALSALPEQCRYLQFGSTVLLTQPSATHIERWVAAQRGQRIIVLDPNVRPSLIADPAAYPQDCARHLALADLIRLSDEDLAVITPQQSQEQAAAYCMSHGARALILTRGAQGASLLRPGHAPLHIQPPNITVQDTIGAGDTFGAALLVALFEQGVSEPEHLTQLADERWFQALHFAAAAAAINCTRAGAQPPTRAELEAVLSAA